MKKNRRQLKKENRNLRGKMKLKNKNINKLGSCKKSIGRKKEVSIPLTPLKVDGMGNITRLINKKGSVPHTETKMYGCDIEKSVPQFVRRFVHKMGLDETIRVPIRTNGLTGSGLYRRCHQNVSGLVKRIGGKRLQGYIVTGFQIDEGFGKLISFIHHSVWITPEGKCVDVTNNYEDRNLLTEDTIIRKGDKEYILFVPIGLGTLDELGVSINEVVITRRWEKEGVIYYTEKGREDNDSHIFLDKRGLEKFQNTTGFINPDHHVGMTNSPKEIKEIVDLGSFSQRSLGSGKSWDELKKEIVWDKGFVLGNLMRNFSKRFL